MTVGRQLSLTSSPCLSLQCLYCDHSWFFSPPVKEARVFQSGPCPLSQGAPAKTQVTREPAATALRAPLLPGACSSRSSQKPHFRRRSAGAPPAESLTCSAAWRRPVAHLHRILEHPFFGSTAASALTSPGGGPTPPRDALGARRGGGRGKTLEVPVGEERVAGKPRSGLLSGRCVWCGQLA